MDTFAAAQLLATAYDTAHEQPQGTTPVYMFVTDGLFYVAIGFFPQTKTNMFSGASPDIAFNVAFASISDLLAQRQAYHADLAASMQTAQTAIATQTIQVKQ